jgi:hypothetical protein
MTSASTTPSPSSQPSRPRNKDAGRLPILFAHDTQLFGWQGLTTTLPHDWFLRSFGGSHDKGNLRIVDDEGLRLELLWEQTKGTAHVQKSIDRFLASLEKESKKKKQEFRVADNPNVLKNKHAHREQVVNFGWIGDPGDPVASQGWGTAWECTHCKRVIVAHVVGRGSEKSSKTQQLASEVLSTLDCHGQGGWETWSVFGFRLEVPEEFRMGKAKLLAGRLEIEWLRAAKPLLIPIMPWLRRPERVAVQRASAANVVLENEALPDWVIRTIVWVEKKRNFDKPQSIAIRGHEAVLLQGSVRDLRVRGAQWLQTKVGKKTPPQITLRAWHCTDSNKLFVLDTELSAANAHVVDDVLDSLECH